MTIKEARKKAGLTQAKMSELLSIPIKTISNWESETTEKRTPPKYVENLVIDKLLQIAEAKND